MKIKSNHREIELSMSIATRNHKNVEKKLFGWFFQSKKYQNYFSISCFWSLVAVGSAIENMILMLETRVLVIKEIISRRWCHFIKFPPFVCHQSASRRQPGPKKREIKFMTATKRKPDIKFNAYLENFGRTWTGNFIESCSRLRNSGGRTSFHH